MRRERKVRTCALSNNPTSTRSMQGRTPLLRERNDIRCARVRLPMRQISGPEHRQAMAQQALLHHVERTLMTVRTVRAHLESIAPPPMQASVAAAFDAQSLQRHGLIEKLHVRLGA